MKHSKIFITCTEEVKEKLQEVFDEYCPFAYEDGDCNGIKCEDCINIHIHWEINNEYEN